MDTLGIEPRASRMLSGCDTTTPRALKKQRGCCSARTAGDPCSQSGKHRQHSQQHVAPTGGQPTRCHLQTERKKLCMQVPHRARPRGLPWCVMGPKHLPSNWLTTGMC